MKYFIVIISILYLTRMSLGNSELKAGFVTYGDVKALGNDTSTLIIDVRNSTELEQTGKIPGSIHIPSKFYFLFFLRDTFIIL